jgi:recombination associated protein RdgC
MISKNFPRSVSLYSIKQGFVFDTQALAEQLPAFSFTPCLPDSGQSLGFVGPLGGDELVHHLVEGAFVLAIRHQEKVVPAAEVERALKERTDHIEKTELRLVRGAEKQALKIEVILEARKVAFSRYKNASIMVIPSKGLLCVFGVKAAFADQITVLLSKAIGSLPILVAEVPKLDLNGLFKGLFSSHLVEPLGNIALQHTDHGKAHFEILDADIRINEMLTEGYMVDSIRVDLVGLFSFVIKSSFAISGLRWHESIALKSEEYEAPLNEEGVDAAEAKEVARRLQLAANFLLVQVAFSRFVDNFLALFGGLTIRHLAEKGQNEAESGEGVK